jgi:hypothetical protein
VVADSMEDSAVIAEEERTVVTNTVAGTESVLVDSSAVTQVGNIL